MTPCGDGRGGLGAARRSALGDDRTTTRRTSGPRCSGSSPSARPAIRSGSSSSPRRSTPPAIPSRRPSANRAALDCGLGGYRRRRAVIQLASSLRNLGRVDESLALLEAERNTRFDELDDELAAVLALALTSAGREREAVAVALTALAPHLTRYTRSVAAYAEDLA